MREHSKIELEARHALSEELRLTMSWHEKFGKFREDEWTHANSALPGCQAKIQGTVQLDKLSYEHHVSHKRLNLLHQLCFANEEYFRPFPPQLETVWRPCHSR